jgi:hypothetical protein
MREKSPYSQYLYNSYSANTSVAMAFAYALWKSGHTRLEISYHFLSGNEQPENILLHHASLKTNYKPGLINPRRPFMWELCEELRIDKGGGGADSDKDFAQRCFNEIPCCCNFGFYGGRYKDDPNLFVLDACTYFQALKDFKL